MRPPGVEPRTFWSEARRSIQLSYGRIYKIKLSKNPTCQTAQIQASTKQKKKQLVDAEGFARQPAAA